VNELWIVVVLGLAALFALRGPGTGPGAREEGRWACAFVRETRRVGRDCHRYLDLPRRRRREAPASAPAAAPPSAKDDGSGTSAIA
jgi:hypothetical protein